MQTVLIAEDDPACLMFIAETISSMGLVPICCRDGQRAWETFQDNPAISLVITDMQMPHMGGRELIQQIRGVPSRNDLPILIMSAVVGPKDIADLLKAGAAAFLPKPVNCQDLEEYVARNLDLDVAVRP